MAPPLLPPAALAGLIAGVAIFVATLGLPSPPGLPVAGWHTLGLALMMAIWWTTEPVPIGVTALLLVVAFSDLTQREPKSEMDQGTDAPGVAGRER